jgi:hypothetical protein
MDEEVVMLEEQLAAAHADIEQLQTRLADAEARAGTREAELASLRGALETAQETIAERDASLAARDQELESTRSYLALVEGRSREATARYRDSSLAREPHLPADLVTGETVQEIDEALERARQTVAQVRQHLEQQAQAVRVPAGAPARGSPDLSSLSAAEKIRLGVQQG